MVFKLAKRLFLKNFKMLSLSFIPPLLQNVSPLVQKKYLERCIRRKKKDLGMRSEIFSDRTIKIKKERVFLDLSFGLGIGYF